MSGPLQEDRLLEQCAAFRRPTCSVHGPDGVGPQAGRAIIAPICFCGILAVKTSSCPTAPHALPIRSALTDRVRHANQFPQADRRPPNHPLWIACAPSALLRLFREADALLHASDATPAALVRMCSHLVLYLQLRFDAEKTRGALPLLQQSIPHLKVEVDRLLAGHEELLAKSRRLLRVASQERSSPSWRRELNRALSQLRSDFIANERLEMQFVQRADGLDVRETD